MYNHPLVLFEENTLFAVEWFSVRRDLESSVPFLMQVRAALLLATTGARHDSKLFYAYHASPLRSRSAADFHIGDFRTPYQKPKFPSPHVGALKKPGTAIPVRVRRSIVPMYRIFLYGVDCIFISERCSLSVVRAYCHRRYGITMLPLKFRLPPLFGVQYYVAIAKGNSAFTILARETSISPIIQVAVPPRAPDASGARAAEAALEVRRQIGRAHV